MSTSKKTQDIVQLRRFEEALIDSVIAVDHAEFREEIQESGGDFDAYVALANKMIAEAEDISAETRLGEAKAAVAAFQKSTKKVSMIPFNREKYKTKLEAMQSSDSGHPMMLAARKGTGLSTGDEDALLRALAELENLESEDESA